MFDPKTDKYPYPEYTDQHYLKVKKDNGLIFDAHYPYVDRSKSFRRKQNLIRVLLRCIVFPMTYVRLGLCIKGKENLKEAKEMIEEGAISICNHVHMWDYLGIMNAIKPIRPHILAWAPNIRGENSFLIRMVGGIPIPESDFQATKAYMAHVGDMLDRGGWLHIYAEGSMWEYYQPIRPFKVGCSYFACRFGKPIIPMAYSYRKPNWIRRKIFRQIACFTLNIGKPVFANPNLPKAEREIDLVTRCHDAVCALAGIDPKENIYPPIFHNDKRIDYYTKEYGKGYKGSW